MASIRVQLPSPPPASRGATGIREWRTRVSGEPALNELLDDPILHLVMQRDGISRETLCGVIRQARSAIAAPIDRLAS